LAIMSSTSGPKTSMMRPRDALRFLAAAAADEDERGL
jgi:hypothetical protein